MCFSMNESNGLNCFLILSIPVEKTLLNMYCFFSVYAHKRACTEKSKALEIETDPCIMKPLPALMDGQVLDCSSSDAGDELVAGSSAADLAAHGLAAFGRTLAGGSCCGSDLLSEASGDPSIDTFDDIPMGITMNLEVRPHSSSVWLSRKMFRSMSSVLSRRISRSIVSYYILILEKQWVKFIQQRSLIVFRFLLLFHFQVCQRLFFLYKTKFEINFLPSHFLKNWYQYHSMKSL